MSTTTPPAIWRGHLYADGTGGVYGHLRDQFGWGVDLTGVRNPNGPGYVLTGAFSAPEPLRAPDDDQRGPPPEGSFW